MKKQDWTVADFNQLVRRLGGENIARKIQRGEVTICYDFGKRLFDKYGRRVPECLQADVCDADRDFRVNQPKLGKEVDFANRITRLHRYLVDTKVTGRQLKAETERLLAIVRSNSSVANIADGVWLPVVLPKFTTDSLDAELDLYLGAVANSYAKTFGDRIFYSYDYRRILTMAVDGSRHSRLLKKMEQGPVIGIHFPTPLQGFSINASREQMPSLPEGFILSGMDTFIAMVMYPDVLAKNKKTVGLQLAALQCQSYSFAFKASDGGLLFGDAGYLGSAYGGYSSGLLFIE